MRRTHKVAGSVRFPIGDSRYKDTKEGGMFVRMCGTVTFLGT